MQCGDPFPKKTKNNKQSDGIVISPGSAALKFLRLNSWRELRSTDFLYSDE